MICDNEINTIYFSEKLITDNRFKKTGEELFSALDSISVSYKYLPKTRDIWARDYMPVQVSENKFVEYRYDPDYLQGEENRKLEYKVTKPDESRNWAYINYLQTKDVILLPKLNIVENEQAVEQIASIFPEYASKNRIIPIDVCELVAEGGALNCISWNIKT